MKNFYSSLDKDSINLKNLSERDTMYNRFDKQQKEFFHSIQDNIFTYCFNSLNMYSSVGNDTRYIEPSFLSPTNFLISLSALYELSLVSPTI